MTDQRTLKKIISDQREAIAILENAVGLADKFKETMRANWKTEVAELTAKLVDAVSDADKRIGIHKQEAQKLEALNALNKKCIEALEQEHTEIRLEKQKLEDLVEVLTDKSERWRKLQHETREVLL
jgi:hypothetical protein